MENLPSEEVSIEWLIILRIKSCLRVAEGICEMVCFGYMLPVGTTVYYGDLAGSNGSPTDEGITLPYHIHSMTALVLTCGAHGFHMRAREMRV